MIDILKQSYGPYLVVCKDQTIYAQLKGIFPAKLTILTELVGIYSNIETAVYVCGPEELNLKEVAGVFAATTNMVGSRRYLIGAAISELPNVLKNYQQILLI